MSQVVQNPTVGTQPIAGPVDSTLRGLIATVYEASKPRIVRLVSVTSGVGFAMAAVSRRWDSGELALTATAALLGTALSAAGANALNQWMERERDALMPAHLCAAHAAAAAVTGQRAGCGDGTGTSRSRPALALCGIVPAAVSLATVLVYLLVYTPLKPITPLATLVGAIPGALPPLIGWSAAANGSDWATLGSLIPLSLFAIMFVWQIPHFLAIAWMYRDDYAAGGYRVLAVLDPDGRRTARSILLWSILLVPTTVLPAWAMHGPAAWTYGAFAAVAGIAFAYLGTVFYRTRQRADARLAFLASVIHLPLVLIFLVACQAASRLL